MSWSTFWAAFLGGGLAGTILNLIEIVLLFGVIKKADQLLKQLALFKLEGEKDEWLK